MDIIVSALLLGKLNNDVNMVSEQVRDQSRITALEFLTSNPVLAPVIPLTSTIVALYSLRGKVKTVKKVFSSTSPQFN